MSMAEIDGGGRRKPRDDESNKFVPETSVQEIIKLLEEAGEGVPTGDISDEIDYTRDGALKRLRRLKEQGFVEGRDLGQGRPILWSLKYDRRDFLNAFEEVGDLTPTNTIAEEVGCSELVAEEWLFKLEEEGKVRSKEGGKRKFLWSKLSK